MEKTQIPVHFIKEDEENSTIDVYIECPGNIISV